eukprot:5031434-Prymnesium_polylepis.2
MRPTRAPQRSWWMDGAPRARERKIKNTWSAAAEQPSAVSPATNRGRRQTALRCPFLEMPPAFPRGPVVRDLHCCGAIRAAVRFSALKTVEPLLPRPLARAS